MFVKLKDKLVSVFSQTQQYILYCTFTFAACFGKLTIIRPSLQELRNKMHALQIAFVSNGIPYYMNVICTACTLFLSF